MKPAGKRRAHTLYLFGLVPRIRDELCGAVYSEETTVIGNVTKGDRLFASPNVTVMFVEPGGVTKVMVASLEQPLKPAIAKNRVTASNARNAPASRRRRSTRVSANVAGQPNSAAMTRRCRAFASIAVLGLTPLKI